MPSEEPSEPIYYNSIYRHGVDEKRRVQIPAKWRPARPEVLTLVLWPKGTLAEAMAKSAVIEKEAMLVGLVDRFEIWNPERYLAASAVDDALLPEAFKLI